MSKVLQLRRGRLAGLVGALATACGSTTAPAARVTAVEPVELRAAGEPAPRPTAAAPVGERTPRVVLAISAPVDRSATLDVAERDRIAVRLGRALARPGYAVVPIDAPAAAELDADRQSAFAVAPVIERIAIGADVECRIQIRIAPWRGRDGGERWDTGRTALVRATARVSGARDPRAAGRGCVEAAIDEIAARRVLPFLDRVAAP